MQKVTTPCLIVWTSVSASEGALRTTRSHLKVLGSAYRLDVAQQITDPLPRCAFSRKGFRLGPAFGEQAEEWRTFCVAGQFAINGIRNPKASLATSRSLSLQECSSASLRLSSLAFPRFQSTATFFALHFLCALSTQFTSDLHNY